MRRRRLEGEGESGAKTVMSTRREVMVKHGVREHIITLISRDIVAMRERGRRERRREGGSTGKMDTMEGEEMTKHCGEREEERIMDRAMDNISTEITGKLVMALEKDTSRKVEVKGHIDPDKVVVGRTLPSQMLTQQKTSLDIIEKRSPKKLLFQELE